MIPPFLIKAVGLIKKVTASGLIKPLPLSGIGKEVAQVWENKTNVKGWLRLTAYVIGGGIVWAVLFKSFPIDKALRLLEVFGF